ncbi:MAG: hypothetical protein ACREII_07825 [Nitrospiraceae bacterium]
MPRQQNSLLARALVILVAGVVGTLVSVPAAASERTVRGEVVVVNVTDLPPVIVLKTMTPSHEERIVGATVDSGTVITRGKDRVTLGAIKVGEQAAMTYLKNPNGLLARSIQVR